MAIKNYTESNYTVSIDFFAYLLYNSIRKIAIILHSVYFPPINAPAGTQQ